MRQNELVEWCNKADLHHRAANCIEDVSSVVDVGCGIRPQRFIVPDLLICIEPHLEYVHILKQGLEGGNVVIIPLDAQTALKALPDNSVDSVFLIDVIEHMLKDEGLDVIRESERVARKQVVIFTPLGYMPQEVHAGELDGWNLHGSERQDHKSGWYFADFPGWHILACKDLHNLDHRGHPIEPPYGGFYAMKNISKSENIYNDLYSEEVIGAATRKFLLVHELFPDFTKKVIQREIERSKLDNSIQFCQRVTELLIQSDNQTTLDHIFNMVRHEQNEAYLSSARTYNKKIDKFAYELSIGGRRENELTSRAAELTSREAELTSREAELTSREAELTSREAELTSREAELIKLVKDAVQEPSGSAMPIVGKVIHFFKKDTNE